MPHEANNLHHVPYQSQTPSLQMRCLPSKCEITRQQEVTYKPYRISNAISNYHIDNMHQQPIYAVMNGSCGDSYNAETN